MSVRLHVVVRGHVQGVGFREWTRRTATSLGLTGYARNEPDGSVDIVAEGARDAAEALLRALAGPTPGTVDSSEHDWSDAKGERGFSAG